MICYPKNDVSIPGLRDVYLGKHHQTIPPGMEIYDSIHFSLLASELVHKFQGHLTSASFHRIGVGCGFHRIPPQFSFWRQCGSLLSIHEGVRPNIEICIHTCFCRLKCCITPALLLRCLGFRSFQRPMQNKLQRFMTDGSSPWRSRRTTGFRCSYFLFNVLFDRSACQLILYMKLKRCSVTTWVVLWGLPMSMISPSENYFTWTVPHVFLNFVAYLSWHRSLTNG